MNKKIIISAVLAVAASQLVVEKALAEKKADPKGKCYGIVGKEEGDCGGKDPVTGQSWSCAGHNPTADLGWKKMKQSECYAAEKHKDATEKKFVANK